MSAGFLNPFSLIAKTLMTRTSVSNVARPSTNPVEQRREVKAIARYVESEIATYQTTRDAKLSHTGLSAMEARLVISQQNLSRLRNEGLSFTRPSSSIGRSFKSAALLSGAAVSRAAAIPVAGALGVVETGARLAVVPMVTVMSGCIGGASTAAMGGILAPVVLMPIGMVAGCVGGSVAFGLSAAAAGIVNAPVFASQKGSAMRTAFKKIDQFDAASAHVERKKLSTAEILENTGQKTSQMISKLRAKKEKFIYMSAD